MRLLVLTMVLLVMVFVASCSQSPTSPAGSPGANSALNTSPIPSITAPGIKDSVFVRFGHEEAGSQFPPESGHDASGHATDKMIPRTVVLSVGGAVTFEIDPFHRPAIYAPGTTPDDINADIASGAATIEDLTSPVFIPHFIINDPVNRLALGPALSFAEQTWTTPVGTFDTPGRYLVICTTFPHFEGSQMYGWAIVK